MSKPLRLNGWLIFGEPEHARNHTPEVRWKHPGLEFEKAWSTRAQPVQVVARPQPVKPRVKKGLTDSQRRVLQLFRRHGSMTDERLVQLSGMTPSGARSRRAELVAAGELRDSRRRGALASGGTGRIWERVI